MGGRGQCSGRERSSMFWKGKGGGPPEMSVGLESQEEIERWEVKLKR